MPMTLGVCADLNTVSVSSPPSSFCTCRKSHPARFEEPSSRVTNSALPSDCSLPPVSSTPPRTGPTPAPTESPLPSSSSGREFTFHSVSPCNMLMIQPYPRYWTLPPPRVAQVVRPERPNRRRRPRPLASPRSAPGLGLHPGRVGRDRRQLRVRS